MAYPLPPIRGTYRPIKKALIVTVIGIIAVFLTALYLARQDLAYALLYQLGLALPSTTHTGLIPLGHYATIGGSSHLTWLGITLIIFGLAYAIDGATHIDYDLRQSAEAMLESIREKKYQDAQINAMNNPGHTQQLMQPADPFHPQQVQQGQYVNQSPNMGYSGNGTPPPPPGAWG